MFNILVPVLNTILFTFSLFLILLVRMFISADLDTKKLAKKLEKKYKIIKKGKFHSLVCVCVCIYIYIYIYIYIHTHTHICNLLEALHRLFYCINLEGYCNAK